MLAWMFAVTAAASGLSDDNSLSDLGLHNGTAEPEFVYSTWEYDVTVEPGTQELYLEPVTSNPNATITSITGTVLQDGKATVLINIEAESGQPMTYTLHVTEGEGAAGEAESETQQSEVQTETQATEAQTETQATESAGDDNTVKILQAQVDKLKADTDLTMKIIYGLIALAVILLFVIINLILKNRDLKDDLRDAENQLDFQTNEFARKERSMDTENYYAPIQQDRTPEPQQEERAEKPIPTESETFGTVPGAAQGDASAKEEGKDVDVTMVDL